MRISIPPYVDSKQMIRLYFSHSIHGTFNTQKKMEKEIFKNSFQHLFMCTIIIDLIRYGMEWCSLSVPVLLEKNGQDTMKKMEWNEQIWIIEMAIGELPFAAFLCFPVFIIIYFISFFRVTVNELKIHIFWIKTAAQHFFCFCFYYLFLVFLFLVYLYPLSIYLSTIYCMILTFPIFIEYKKTCSRNEYSTFLP